MIDPPLRDLLLEGGRPRFAGLRLISDVHGQAAAFGAAVADAAERDLAVLQLGDLIDRGPSSDGAARIALDLIATRRGLFVVGNHDDKLRRAVKGNPVRIGANLRRSLEQLERADLAQRFAEAVAAAPLWLRCGRTLFVHGAFGPGMFDQPAPVNYSHPTTTKLPLAHLALYGETSGVLDADGEPTRTYGWVDQIPAGHTVYVGHDIVRPGEVTVLDGQLGGRAVCLDTGAWLDGRVSWLDLDTAALGIDGESVARSS
ncbi:MAG: metallophosphoesterase [Proteobacteria bacterium]|nr:metallophosphoesterase [Pseudomonadota bacterium]